MTARLSGYRILRRVLREQDACWRHFTGILLLGLVTAPLCLVPPLAIKIAVDNYLGGQPLPAILSAVLPASLQDSPGDLLAVAVGLLLAGALLAAGFSSATNLLQTHARERLVLGFRSRLFHHVERLSLSYHDREGAADSTFRVLLDTATIPAVVLDGVLPLVSASVLLAVMTVVVVSLSWQLALVALLVAPLLIVVALPFGRRLRKQWHDVKALDTEAMSLLQEVFAAMRVVKAFGKEQSEADRLIGLARQGMQARIGVARTQSLFDSMIKVGTALGTAAVLMLGAMQVKDSALTLGELLMVAALLAQLYQPLQVIVGQTAAMQSSLASAERALGLLDEAPEVRERTSARALDRARGDVAFRSVTFGYREQPVLKDVDFHVAAGSRIGVAGATGAGKTTLINLLCRLYDPDQGAILLDGTDIRDLKLKDLRRQFAVVLQEPVLFKCSVAENINYARPEASIEQTVAAARSANAHDFISALPQGYGTLVGERGMQLSGGERQRIALARAFLKDAPILILDEPTSSVDVRTEQAILDALQRLMAGRTTFLIAHRATTLSSCDKVLVLDRGRIAAFEQPGSATFLSALMLTTAGGAGS